MIGLNLRIKVPKITIKTPAQRFWQRVGLKEVGMIQERTEVKHKDANERQFNKYSDAYKKLRAKTGRSRHVTLSYTGRMLKSMGRGIRASKNRVRIILSGGEGFKAWVLERGGREFFSISKKREEAIRRNVIRELTKKNNLK
jgi:hypothetical protein